MSEHIEQFKNVDVIWNRESDYLDIRSTDGTQLALLRVEEVD